LRQTDVASIEEEVEESPDADGSFERAERPPRLKRTIGVTAKSAPAQFFGVADAWLL